MTTYDPDTLEQDRNVLFRIVKEFEGTMALDCSVLKPGKIRVGDEVTVWSYRQSRPADTADALPYIDIARAGGDFDFGPAAAHRPLQFVTAQGALHGDGQIGMD